MAHLYNSPKITDFGQIDLTLGRRGSAPDGRSMNTRVRKVSMRKGEDDRSGGESGDGGDGE